jgi:hypothetical protein
VGRVSPAENRRQFPILDKIIQTPQPWFSRWGLSSRGFKKTKTVTYLADDFISKRIKKGESQGKKCHARNYDAQ